MQIINFKLISSYIFPSLISSTIWNALILVVFVFVIGLVTIVTKPEDEQTFLYATIGCFFGIQIICMIPLFAMPGVIQALGRGSGYAALFSISLNLIPFLLYRAKAAGRNQVLTAP